LLDAWRGKKRTRSFPTLSIGLRTKSENGDCLEERLELLNTIKHNKLAA
jgi:hypothetical protein